MKSNPSTLSLVIACLLTGCDHPENLSTPAPDLPPVKANTGKIESREVPVFEEVVGTVRPRQEAQVAAKLTGRVLEIRALPGMKAKAGEVLAKLEVKELEAALVRARETVAQADRELARQRLLRESGAATQAQFEQAESVQRIAAATVQETQATLANAAVAAPFDGTVTRKFVEPGDLAAPGRALFAMEDSSLLRLEIAVAESLAGTVKIGDTFTVEIAGADARVAASVSEIAPSADVGSRTFSIKLDLPAAEGLRAGQFGRALLPRGSRSAVTVPTSAVISRGQMDYVFVAVENIARLRIVRTGEPENGEIEILAGLDSGETIVLDPPMGLIDGQPLS